MDQLIDKAVETHQPHDDEDSAGAPDPDIEK
jgi:hypothetical protein